MSTVAKSRSWISRWQGFWQANLWQMDLARMPWLRRSGYSLLQAASQLWRSIGEKKMFLQAGGLTYSTMLAIVPTLALAFAILKGMRVHYSTLERFILEHATAGSQEIVSLLIDYAGHINPRSLGLIGLIATLLTVILLLTSIENAFNQVWGVEKPRTFKNQVADYFLLVIVMPLFLVTALSFTASLKSTFLIGFLREKWGLSHLFFWGWRLAPYFILWFFFTFFFVFMPNTRVRIKPALIAGLVTGTSWQIAEWAYVTLQVGFARYNTIYGTLAQLPIMMVWLFIAWVIVLAGVDVCHTLQNFSQIREQRRYGQPPVLLLESTVVILTAIHQAFLQGRPGHTAEELAAESLLPLARVHKLLGQLDQAGIVASTQQHHRSVYLPARDLEHLPLVEVIEVLEGGDQILAMTSGDQEKNRIRILLNKSTAARRRALRGEYVISRADPARAQPTPRRFL